MNKKWVLLLPLSVLFFSFDIPGFNNSPDLDHASVLKSLNRATLEKGRQIYTKSCIACHGEKGTASNPQARSFSKDPLRFGNKPYDMWRTISNGAGLMAPQTWLSPTERYYVIQYIRETFIKSSNPKQYFKIDDKYLASLPKSQKSIAQQLAISKKEALAGSQKYGQEWFQNHKSDYGTAIHSQLKNHGSAVLTLQLGHGYNLSYNLLRMGITACWKGGLNLSETKYQKYRGEGQPFIQGKEIEGLDQWEWTYNDRIDQLEKITSPRSPLPKEYLDYRGHYLYKKDVVLSYAVVGRNVLEFPQAISLNKQVILSQTIYISAGASPQKVYIGYLSNGQQYGSGKGIATLINPKTKKFLSAAILSAQKDIKCEVDSLNRMVLTVPASTVALTLQVLRTTGNKPEALRSFAQFVQKRSALNSIPDISKMIVGGPAQWAKKVIATGELNANNAHFDPIFREDIDRSIPTKAVPIPADYPYTIDRIGLPFNNAYNAWVRPTCLGFKSDGSLVIGTYTGDVWLAKGVDDSLKHIRWQRIATGLFEPMGLKIIKDEIYVTTRLGIILLHDLNGDGETDFYEHFHNDQDVSSFFHSFNFGLETDSKGFLYYNKAGEYTDNKDPGNVIKISPDGKYWESIATGFRVNNGITISPDDKILVSDNQGDWEPANKICLIKKGAYYGYVPNLVSDGWSPDGKKFTKDQMLEGQIKPEIVKVPDSFQQPILWMPQEFDNSPGGGVWSDKTWGPLGNQFIHTSYGTGWVYYVGMQEVGGITQGSMMALPFQLDAGIQRATVNPVDKQVYVTGLTGWDDPEAIKYGVLCRVRYKGGEGHLLMGTQIVHDGIKLHFNFILDDTICKNLSRFDITQWNYKWTHHYGSAHYSIKQPEKEGEDKLQVQNAELADEGKSVILHIPNIGPAQTMRLRFEVKGKDGVKLKDFVYLTIHKIPTE